MIRSFIKGLVSNKREQLPLSMNRRNLELVFPRNPRRYYPMVNDKLQTKEVLAANHVPLAPTLATFSSFRDVHDLDEKLAGMDEFVIKPARGSGGRGITIKPTIRLISYREIEIGCEVESR